MASIVLVEDELLLRRSIRRHLEHEGHRVAETDAIGPALALVREIEADAVITDLSLGAENGLDLIEQLRSDGFDGGIIIITAHASVAGAVQGIKQGADEYLQKPISLQELQRLLLRALEDRQVRRRLSLYQRIEQILDSPPPLIGENGRWRVVLESAHRLANLPSSRETGMTSILISGETGVGKRSLARYIHARSSSKESPFVHIRCFALSETVLEAELFGNEEGLHAHGGSLRPGIFELADGGTVFFEEIAEMPMPLQAKLLAVLEQGVATRLGGKRGLRVRVRVIASTSQRLEERVDAGSFRPDLFYRLQEMSLVVPPLRQRGDDILLLAESFLGVVGKEFGRPHMHFSSESRQSLRSHPWPGNVQELQSVVRRATALTIGDEIAPADLGIRVAAQPAAAEQSEPVRARSQSTVLSDPGDLRFDFSHGPIRMEEIEKGLIIAALYAARGNISRASKLMDMTRSSLRYRIDRYRLGELVREIHAS